MMPIANTAERAGLESGPLSPELQSAVRAELETMLVAPIFVHSGRCKRFLSYIVEQTLAGNANHLKERTIGIAVFDRANDYHTGDDSIVRVTANEVRKRISQFYQESPHAHLIQIELPRGSYVPEFRIQPSRFPDKSAEAARSNQPEAESIVSADPSAAPTTSDLPVHRHSSVDLEPIAAAIAPIGFRPRKRVVYSILLVLLVVAVALFSVWKLKSPRQVPDLWSAFLHANVPVLLCIDTHNLQPLVPDQTVDGQSFVNLVLRRQIISLDDAAILSSMASQLGKKDVRFRVVGAEQTSLADFRRQPVILIGAVENKWTLRLTQTLPYRIEVANPPGSGSGKEPTASIVDSAHPANTPWVIDFSVPFAAWKSDYAIVARMDDTTTGVPVLIEAGLGNDGTVAASELIASGSLERTLAGDRSCQGKNNFEAVVETQIIDTKSGPPHVLRLACW